MDSRGVLSPLEIWCVLTIVYGARLAKKSSRFLGAANAVLYTFREAYAPDPMIKGLHTAVGDQEIGTLIRSFEYFGVY